MAPPARADRKSGSAGMPRPISYAVFCLKKKNLQVPDEYNTRQISIHVFSFNNTTTTTIYTLSLHDALPIWNIRALNGRFNTSITHAYSIVIGSKHITLNATGGGFLTASKQFRHGATSKS